MWKLQWCTNDCANLVFVCYRYYHGIRFPSIILTTSKSNGVWGWEVLFDDVYLSTINLLVIPRHFIFAFFRNVLENYWFCYKYEPQHEIFQQCGMCDQQRLKPACAYAQSAKTEPLLVACV